MLPTKYLNEKQVAVLINKALSTLRNDRHMGRGLPYVKERKSVRYDLRDVHEYMACHKVIPGKRPEENGRDDSGPRRGHQRCAECGYPTKEPY